MPRILQEFIDLFRNAIQVSAWSIPVNEIKNIQSTKTLFTVLQS